MNIINIISQRTNTERIVELKWAFISLNLNPEHDKYSENYDDL